MGRIGQKATNAATVLWLLVAYLRPK